MFVEWKRIFANRNMFLATLLLILLNCGLFGVESIDSDLISTMNETKRRQEVLLAWESESLSTQEIRTQHKTAETLLNLFYFQQIKQSDPDLYSDTLIMADRELRLEYPDLALSFDSGIYSEDDIRSEYNVLSDVLLSIDYTSEFYVEIAKIYSNAHYLAAIDIFNNSDGATDANLTKTKEDYERIESLSITAGNDIPVNKILAYSSLPIIYIVFSIIIVSQALEEKRYKLHSLIFATQNGRTTLTFWRFGGLLLGSIVFSLLISASTIATAIILYGPINLDRAAQSIPLLFGVTVPLKIYIFLALYICWNVIIQLMLISIIWALFSCLNQQTIAMLGLLLVAGISMLLYTTIPDQSIFVILKYGNPISILDFYNMVSNYRNLDIASVLINKNVIAIATAILTSIICNAISIWCSIYCYSILTYENSFSSFQKCLKYFSKIYHRTISHYSLPLLELHDNMFSQRASIVILVLVFILIQFYPQKNPVYVGEAKLIKNFYQEWNGSGLTSELDCYVSELRIEQTSIESAWLAAVDSYQNGSMSSDEYELEYIKYQAYEVQRAALESITAAITYIEDQQANGYSACLVDPNGYDKLFQEEIKDQILELGLALCTILISANIFLVEHKNRLLYLVRSTPNGRGKLGILRILLAVLFSFVVFAIYILIKVYSTATSYDIVGITFPVHSLSLFAESPANWSIGISMFVYWLSEWIVFAIVALITCLLAQFFSYSLTVLIASMISIVPSVLYLLGFEIFKELRLWKLMCDATDGILYGNWTFLVILILIGVVISVSIYFIWKSGRRTAK